MKTSDYDLNVVFKRQNPSNKLRKKGLKTTNVTYSYLAKIIKTVPTLN